MRGVVGAVAMPHWCYSCHCHAMHGVMGAVVVLQWCHCHGHHYCAMCGVAIVVVGPCRCRCCCFCAMYGIAVTVALVVPCVVLPLLSPPLCCMWHWGHGHCATCGVVVMVIALHVGRGHHLCTTCGVTPMVVCTVCGSWLQSLCCVGVVVAVTAGPG